MCQVADHQRTVSRGNQSGRVEIGPAGAAAKPGQLQPLGARGHDSQGHRYRRRREESERAPSGQPRPQEGRGGDYVQQPGGGERADRADMCCEVAVEGDPAEHGARPFQGVDHSYGGDGAVSTPFARSRLRCSGARRHHELKASHQAD